MKKLLLAAAGAIALSVPGMAQTTPSDNEKLFGLTFFKNELITIDPATGAGTLVQSAGEAISGYGLAPYQERLFTFNPNTNTLDQLSRVDGHVVQRTDIGVTGLRGEGDLAIRSDTGMAYLTSAFDTDGNPTNPLYTFNVNLGVASVKLTNTPVALDGLAFDSNQTLYAIGQGDSGANDPAQADATLYTVDQLTGALTAIGPLGVPQNSPVAGINFAEDGTLYGAIDDKLFQIDKTTGAATRVDATVPDFSFNSVSGLASAQGASVLANIATRANVGAGENAVIAGFMVRPQASPSPTPVGTPSTPTKQVIIRGLGPSVKIAGSTIAGALADPVLTLHNSSGTEISSNDNWKDSPQRTTIEQNGLAPESDLESVIVATVEQGDYTAILRGKSDTTGLGLVEVYDVQEDNGLKTANLSTRAFVSTGDNAVIGGIINEGSASKRVIFRGIGPSLQGQVSQPLADPTLQLFDANGAVIAANDNYKDSAQIADIQASGLAPTDDREAVIAQTLAPGPYTAVLRGVGGTSGTAVVEAYDRD